MITATTDFKNACDDPNRIPEKKIVINGTDRSSLVDSIDAIDLRQYEGDDVTAIPLAITLRNNDKTFNAIRTNKPGNFGTVGVVSLGHGADFVDVFSGKLDDVEYHITDQHRATLTFAHKLKACVERTLGSEAYPITYTDMNPADLSWELLVTRGGLDATAGAGNPDIDYAYWLDYKTICTELGFVLSAEFKGQSIAEALRLIGYLTDALIFPDPTGKAMHRKLLPREDTTYYTFTDANAHLQGTTLRCNRSRVINKMKAWYGYNPATQTWAGSVTKENATSQANYGLLGREADSTAVYHANLLSATAWAERMVGRYTDPADTLEFRTKRGTQAPLFQIGDIPQITCDAHDLSAQKMQVYGINHQPWDAEGEVTLLVEDLGQLNQLFFIADSLTNGIADLCVAY
ncbi:MAG: hypothetical protein OEW15_18560 [Nitrospirota bacterium]|nr:hypothetical protein [Nitrospirota bacterium]